MSKTNLTGLKPVTEDDYAPRVSRQRASAAVVQIQKLTNQIRHHATELPPSQFREVVQRLDAVDEVVRRRPAVITGGGKRTGRTRMAAMLAMSAAFAEELQNLPEDEWADLVAPVTGS